MSGARCIVGLGVLLVCLHHVAAVAVMSVDLGSEWMKVAVVSVSLGRMNLIRFYKFPF